MCARTSLSRTGTALLVFASSIAPASACAMGEDDLRDAEALFGAGRYAEALEAVNRTFVELRRALPLPQAAEDLQFARGMVVEAVANCPEEALEEGRYGECGIQAGIAHDTEHAETIEAWRKGEGI